MDNKGHTTVRLYSIKKLLKTAALMTVITVCQKKKIIFAEDSVLCTVLLWDVIAPRIVALRAFL